MYTFRYFSNVLIDVQDIAYDCFSSRISIVDLFILPGVKLSVNDFENILVCVWTELEITSM